MATTKERLEHISKTAFFAKRFCKEAFGAQGLPLLVWIYRRATIGSALLGLTIGASAAPVYLSDLPDFYQHQLSGSDASNPFARPANFAGYSDPAVPDYSNTQPLDDSGPGVQWERNGGWCYIASFTDVFYQLDKRGASGLFDHGGEHTWLERMNYAISDLAIHVWGLGGVERQPIREFIADKVGPDRIAIDIFTWDIGLSRVMRNGEATSFTSMYTLYRSQVAMGNSAVFDLINPGPANPEWWWNSSYHRVAAAGYDDETSAIYFADPNGNGNDPALANWGHPYEEDDPLPVGESYYNFNTMDESGALSGSSGFSGAQVRNLFVLSIVPEPSTYALLLLGGAASLWALTRRKS
jgi:hypothetical protein